MAWILNLVKKRLGPFQKTATRQLLSPTKPIIYTSQRQVSTRRIRCTITVWIIHCKSAPTAWRCLTVRCSPCITEFRTCAKQSNPRKLQLLTFSRMHRTRRYNHTELLLHLNPILGSNTARFNQRFKLSLVPRCTPSEILLQAQIHITDGL